jgi:hypothetical protein
MASKCSAAVIELINDLKKEIPDENVATVKYLKLSTQMSEIRKDIPGLDLYINFQSAMLNKIASEEATHAIILEGLIKTIEDECEG